MLKVELYVFDFSFCYFLHLLKKKMSLTVKTSLIKLLEGRSLADISIRKYPRFWVWVELAHFGCLIVRSKQSLLTTLSDFFEKNAKKNFKRVL
jgi:hypothetical protein